MASAEPIVIAIHGGAGTIPERIDERRSGGQLPAET